MTEDILLFRGSCGKCGVFQEKYGYRCDRVGCLVMHYYPDIECECGNILVHGNHNQIFTQVLNAVKIN